MRLLVVRVADDADDDAVEDRSRARRSRRRGRGDRVVRAWADCGGHGREEGNPGGTVAAAGDEVERKLRLACARRSRRRAFRPRRERAAAAPRDAARASGQSPYGGSTRTRSYVRAAAALLAERPASASVAGRRRRSAGASRGWRWITRAGGAVGLDEDAPAARRARAPRGPSRPSRRRGRARPRRRPGRAG